VALAEARNSDDIAYRLQLPYQKLFQRGCLIWLIDWYGSYDLGLLAAKMLISARI
jgi:hypothetical protein